MGEGGTSEDWAADDAGHVGTCTEGARAATADAGGTCGAVEGGAAKGSEGHGVLATGSCECRRPGADELPESNPSIVAPGSDVPGCDASRSDEVGSDAPGEHAASSDEHCNDDGATAFIERGSIFADPRGQLDARPKPLLTWSTFCAHSGGSPGGRGGKPGNAH